jgi:hypothetical protein
MEVTTDSKRILDKLDEIGKGVTVLQTQMPAAQALAHDQETRLRAVELRMWATTGALGLLVFVVPIGLRYLPYF